jgi:cytochrome c oxidase subunit IV
MTLAEYGKRRPEGLDPLDGEGPHEAGEHAHPGPAEYLRIGFILLVLTTIEVALYYTGMNTTMLVITMLPLSWLKFALVVFWFMHLRFDNPFFRNLFFGGLALSLVVFTIAIATLGGKLV